MEAKTVGQIPRMSAKVRGLLGNVVGQSKWLSDKFNKDYFGQDQSLMSAKCKFSNSSMFRLNVSKTGDF